MRTMLCVIVLLMTAVSVPASAQYHGDDGDDGDDTAESGELAGALRFHVDVPMFRYGLSTTKSEAGGETRTSKSSGTSFGTPAGLLSGFGNLNLGFGYAVTESIVIGTSAQLGYESVGDPDNKDPDFTLLSVGVAPYFEYLGGDSSTRPFLGVTAYVRYAEIGAASFDGSGTTEKQSDTIFGGGLLGGAHLFMSSGASVDLTGRVTYGLGSGPDAGPDIDTSMTVLDVLLSIGVSAWIL